MKGHSPGLKQEAEKKGKGAALKESKQAVEEDRGGLRGNILTGGPTLYLYGRGGAGDCWPALLVMRITSRRRPRARVQCRIRAESVQVSAGPSVYLTSVI